MGDLTLDISSITSNEFHVERLTAYYIPILKIKPNYSKFIQKVVNGSTTLWKSTSGKKCVYLSLVLDNKQPLMLKLDVVESKEDSTDPKGEETLSSPRSTHSTTPIHSLANSARSIHYDGALAQESIYIDVRRSKVISDHLFFEAFHKMVSKHITYYSVSLNISGSNNETMFYNVNRHSYSVYVPTPGYALTKVKDGLSTIWKGGSATCTHVTVYFNGLRPVLVGLWVKNGSSQKPLYFRKKSRWSQINEDEYARKLSFYGLSRSTLEICTVDINNTNDERLCINSLSSLQAKVTRFTPLPGCVVKRVMDGKTTIWDSVCDDKCVYIWLYSRGDTQSTIYLLVHGHSGRKVLYYAKNVGGKWNSVDSYKHISILTTQSILTTSALSGVQSILDARSIHETVYAHSTFKPKIVMGSFINSKGLSIKTYECRVQESKGRIVLVHGAWGYFGSIFLRWNVEWNNKHFGYTPIEHCNSFDMSTYSHIFKDSENALEALPQCQYEGSLVEALNDLGYSVYAIDLQSMGRSESVTDTRFYVEDFNDFARDVAQYVEIVKGKGCKECHLIGFSMGGNIVLRAAMEYKKATGDVITDSVICIGGMYNIESQLDTMIKRLGIRLSHGARYLVPKMVNMFEDYKCFGKSNDSFMWYNDPFTYDRNLAVRTVFELFKAARELDLQQYPDVLPTLFIHSIGDPMCSIQGARNVSKQLEGNAKLVELEGDCHNIVASHFVSNLTPILRDWLMHK
ncbi:hypothetical protein BEWA_001680 [Theileria equi strain WA]|uniref:Serine aminopeptidase S33 domain-containing protein n=1 Tax=Theileria equi strain WA TaxID=1537102 RepID=L0B0H1_THEEQ|nr:hypothetical protein BEWA_001680 [Theileria equi strain WA]AFZ80761.1 hypothetical protein BEWA_001680 [Theileria equi strain WA]|eukprot:XP_004830427.1 hypothetical protein BEWA_001680 [Theileria equi strain WA]